MAILEDDSGAIVLNTSAGIPPQLTEGQRVLAQANCLVGKDQLCEPLINNDGLHSAKQESGSILLSRGMYPIRVEWFNGPAECSLNVDWLGPKIKRQPISGTSLWRLKEKGQSSNLASGVSCSAYEGAFKTLPNFSSHLPIREGFISNFDINFRTRPANSALVFNSYLSIPHNGTYTFWLKSDDGSKLFIGDNSLRFEVLGEGTLSPPIQLSCEQTVSADYESKWVMVEGAVNFANESSQAQELEIISKAGRTQISFLERSPGSLGYLQGCQIAVEGLVESAFTVHQQTNFSILAPNINGIIIKAMPAENWQKYPVTPLSQVKLESSPIHVKGTVYTNLSQGFVIKDNTAQLQVMTELPISCLGQEIEILGKVVAEGTNTVLRSLFYVQSGADHENGLSPLTPITQAAVIKKLTRAEAQQSYPVKIRGVITSAIETGFSIQDTTWSTYLSRDRSMTGDIPKVGDYCEVQGNTVMIFAPSVTAKRITRLGKGILPAPVLPRWDELMNGSLDTQYIQLEGYVVAVSENIIHLLTRDGKLRLRLPDIEEKDLGGLTGALISIRGVNSPERDLSQRTILGQLRLFNAAINIKEPAPALPFEAPVKHTYEMLTFDFNANALQRIKVAGQVINSSHGEYFLLEENNGLRFKTSAPASVEPGDLVEVVGFPSMNGAFPYLHEAIVRTTGKSKLPEAIPLPEDATLKSRLDSTLVRVKARVLSVNLDHSEQKIELQSGKRVFVARLERDKGIIPNIPEGSLVEVQGTFLGLQNTQIINNNIDSFQVLLQTPSDLRVISKPSWWTPKHTFAVIGSLGSIILLGMIWITLLRRQVAERSQRLADEIRVRQKAEHQKALEEERFRIARDLHDDLGATLTQIRFLSALESSGDTVQEATRGQLKQISEKSRQMVGALDEIVWAVNPRNDSLRSLTAYLRHVAEELFARTTIKCRLNIDKALPDVQITSTVRHNLYLAVKEALNNCAKHSNATELWLHVHYKDQELQIIVEDNGRGFSQSEIPSDNNGLLNMRHRLEQIGGHFEFESRQGSGTACRMSLHII